MQGIKFLARARSAKQRICIAFHLSPLTASRALLTAAASKPLSTSSCTSCLSGCHSWRQIARYKSIASIKKKITDKSKNRCDTNSKIPYQRQDLFNGEDSDRYASIWLLYRGSSFDHKPLWLFFSYKQNIEMFLQKKKKKQKNQYKTPKWQMQTKKPKKKVHYMILFFHRWWGKA